MDKATENKCPYCDQPLTRVYADYLDTVLCELIEECKACDYREEFAYGHYRTIYKGVEQ